MLTGFDYVKYDACFSASRYGTPSASFQRYEAFSKALAKTGREIFYSVSLLSHIFLMR